MRRLILSIFCGFVLCCVYGQNITSAEYFFDNNDNGFGNNASLAVSQINQSYTISTAGLSDGFHSLYIRVFDQAANAGSGMWSHYDRSTFYVKSFLTGQNIIAARYFIDNGSATSLTISPISISVDQNYSIPVNGLSEGFHSLYIETQDTDGTWSHYDRSVFYVSSFPQGQNIVAARYYFNDDAPTSLVVDAAGTTVTQSYSISASELSEGFHSFYIETQLEDGTWSLYDRQIIYVNNFSNMPADIVAAEYFIDEDLGFGMGNSFDFNSTMLSVQTDPGISEGDHLFCVRVQNANGEWSLYDCAIFNVDSNLGVEDSLYKMITVSPNPFKNSINIEVKKQLEFKKIEVIDFTGKKVYHSNQNLRRINLDNLESGTYILRLRTETETGTFKIIKQ